MDYEKAYKEAFKRARAKYAMKDQPIHQDLVDIFPELKESEESEDEKIINNIKKVIGWYRGMFTEKSLMPEEYQEIDAWLEKQKREEPSIADIVNEHYWEMLGDEKHGEQKPAWSEEDEKMIENIIDTINIAISDCDVDDVGTKARFTLEKERDWFKNKLKPLRFQSQWKPSFQIR